MWLISLQIPNGTAEDIERKLDETLTEVGIGTQWDAKNVYIIGFVSKNTWSRAARREAAKGIKTADKKGEPAMGFKITLRNTAGDQRGVEIDVRWLMGNDSILFESFCGMLKRKLEA